MINETHDQSQRLASEAAISLQRGCTEDAKSLYERAALLEEKALDALPSDKVRTRGILAVSLVSLYYKAAAYEKGEAFVHRFLSRGDLPGFANHQLRELLQTIWDERNLQLLGLHDTGEQIVVSLRGEEVGSGTAPVELVLNRIAGIQSLIYRIAEWRGRFPFRTKGLPPTRVQELCKLWVTQAQAGSYRFGIRLMEPSQYAFPFRDREFTASEISTSLLKVSQVIATEGPEAIKGFIPDKNYRQAMQKLMRNILPDGRKVREIEIVRIHGEPLEKVTLFKETKERISTSLEVDEPSAPTQELLKGTLRGLHLDQKWLHVVTPEGEQLRCDIEREVLDDVVGPMVNQRVIVHGTSYLKRKGKFKLVDIELDTAEASSDAHEEKPEE